MLALAEINALFGSGLFSQRLSVGILLLICVTVVISLICYILYYRLDSRAGYIDGMIPLLLTALTKPLTTRIRNNIFIFRIYDRIFLSIIMEGFLYIKV